MKKLATWALAFVFLLSFALPYGTASAQSYALNWTVDDVEVEGNVQPFMLNDKVLIPVEKLFKEVGFKVSKDESGKVNVTNTHLTVDFDAAAGEIKVNGEKANTEFPLTEKNDGNYISTEFLATLEGFTVKVAADHQSVAINTNRVQDVSAFMAKTAAVDLKSLSTKLTLDMEMESSLDEEKLKMLMDIQSDDIMEPLSSHSISKMSMNDPEGNAIEEVSETYITEDGFFQKMGGTWVKYDDSMTELLQEVTSLQATLLPQLEELQQVFTKGINIYEYDDVYVMTQSLTTEEFNEMLKEASSLLSGFMPVIGTEEVTEEEATEETVIEEEAAAEETVVVETIVEGTVVEETTTEENAEEATTEEAVIDEVIFEEGDLEAIFESLGLNVEEFYFVSNYDKETLFPHDLSGNAHITMAMGEDSFSMIMIINGTFSNFNAVNEIKIPEEVIENAITMEEYIKQLEAEFEQEFKEEFEEEAA